MELHRLLVDCATAEFPLAGAVDIERALNAPDSILKHVAAYDDWVANGKMGAMEYLVRGRDRRADPRIVLPGAKSILCVAIPYRRQPLGAVDSAVGPRYARYIDGPDYHIAIAEKLERVMERFRDACPEAARAGLSWKVCVDTSAVLERAWAAFAGLGWLGKNSVLIHPKHGSYLFLAEVLLTIELGAAPAPLPNYCGNCTRCLSACPTGAFDKPGVLDARRCVSYWTLEKRGELDLTEQQRRGVGTWIAGCDICQEVCPFNIKPTRAEEARAPENWPLTWEEHLDELEDAYRARVKSSALKRVKPAQMSRNLATALENAIAAGPTERFRPLLPKIESRLAAEADPVAKAAWARCLVTLQNT